MTLAGKFIKCIYLTRERGAIFRKENVAIKCRLYLNNFDSLLIKPPPWNICLFIYFSFWYSALFQSADLGQRLELQLTFTRRGNDPGCLQLEWCLCWSLYHSFLFFFSILSSVPQGIIVKPARPLSSFSRSPLP